MPLAIDLYCGLGGWTEGLIVEGWDVVGFDIEQHVYGGERYPGQLVIQDVLTLHGSQFKNADLIVGSSPCQEYSYMAMPWSLAKAKAAAIRADETGELLHKLNALFLAQFRIQREASEAAGRRIPMVVENVCGAQRWVGRAAWNYGSYYLWGDVPALMPSVVGGRKIPGFRFDGSGGSFQTASVEAHVNDGRKFNPDRIDHHTKNTGGSWFAKGPQGTIGSNNNARDVVAAELKPPARVSAQPPADGRKGAGAVWFDQNISSLPSHSSRRKAASAKIAKIPFALSSHIAHVYKP